MIMLPSGVYGQTVPSCKNGSCSISMHHVCSSGPTQQAETGRSVSTTSRDIPAGRFLCPIASFALFGSPSVQAFRLFCASHRGNRGTVGSHLLYAFCHAVSYVPLPIQCLFAAPRVRQNPFSMRECDRCGHRAAITWHCRRRSRQRRRVPRRAGPDPTYSYVASRSIPSS